MDAFQQGIEYLLTIDPWEFIGLVFGLLAVYFLIKENIATWPAGILYCLVSFYVFWTSKLYQDFGLTGFFLVMNIYGWYAWRNPDKTKANKAELAITNTTYKTALYLGAFSLAWTGITGYWFANNTDAAMPYWDATTTGLSLSAMWMTARKKIENWLVWLIVDILATGIYFYKGIYFYSLLYLVYIGMAIAGWLNWQKLQRLQSTAA